MKQKIYLLGLLSVILPVVGIIFKVNHWPAAGILLCTGIFTLIILFLPLALINNYKTADGQRSSLLSVITWLTCLVIFTAMLFKIMHWPGAGIIIFIAMPFPFVVFLPVYLAVTSKIKGFDINNTIIILLLLALQAVFTALLALNVSKERLADSTDLTDNYLNTSNIYMHLPVNNENRQIDIRKQSAVEAADRFLVLIDESNNLIRRITSPDSKGDDFISPIYDKLDSRTLAGKALLSGQVPTQSEKLKKGLDQFVAALKDLDPSGELVTLAASLYDLDQEPGDPEWTYKLFANNDLAWVLADLSSMDTNTRILKQLIITME